MARRDNFLDTMLFAKATRLRLPGSTGIRPLYLSPGRPGNPPPLPPAPGPGSGGYAPPDPSPSPGPWQLGSHTGHFHGTGSQQAKPIPYPVPHGFIQHYLASHGSPSAHGFPVLLRDARKDELTFTPGKFGRIFIGGPGLIGPNDYQIGTLGEKGASGLRALQNFWAAGGHGPHNAVQAFRTGLRTPWA